MQITDVRIRKVAKEGKMKAIVSITIDDEFVIHDIKVIEGEKGCFIAMPSKKSTDGEYRDIAQDKLSRRSFWIVMNRRCRGRMKRLRQRPEKPDTSYNKETEKPI